LEIRVFGDVTPYRLAVYKISEEAEAFISFCCYAVEWGSRLLWIVRLFEQNCKVSHTRRC